MLSRSLASLAGSAARCDPVSDRQMLEAWDEAVGVINEEPDAWRDTLVDKARLPEPIRDIYVISTYPMHQIPTAEQVEAVFAWMEGKGLINEPLVYEDLIIVAP